MDYENFSDINMTDTEADALENDNGELAQPRDALISVLRDIDQNKMDISSIFICLRGKTPESENDDMIFCKAGKNNWRDDLILLESARMSIWDSVKGGSK